MLKGELPEAKPAEIATQPPKTDEAPEESGKPKGNQEAGKGKGIKERNAQLETELQELEARLARKADLKRQLESESGEKTGTPPAETKPAELKEPVEPKEADFANWDELRAAERKYARDLAKYEAAVAVQEDRKLRAEEAAKEKQQSEGKARKAQWDKRVAESVKAHDDWDEVIGPIDQRVKSPEFAFGADVLIEHEMGPEVLHYLGSHPEEFEKILAMRPTAQAAAVGVIAHTLSKPAQSVKAPPGPKKVTETPPPPSELAGRNQLAPDPIAAALESGDTEAYMQLQNAKDIADIAAGKRRR
jgi:hypothetical protein